MGVYVQPDAARALAATTRADPLVQVKFLQQNSNQRNKAPLRPIVAHANPTRFGLRGSFPLINTHPPEEEPSAFTTIANSAR